MRTMSLLPAVLVTLLIVAGPPGSQSRAAVRYTRSASWTSCKALRSRRGEQTIQGLLARQWIVGYLSGVIAAAPEAAIPPFKGSDAIMEDVRRYCQAHPKRMAVDAAEYIQPVSACKP
jgi:hypothetical protein